MSSAAVNQFLPQANAAQAERALIRLSECGQFSPQVRELLQSLVDLSAFALELPISETLSEFEKQLVRLADKATINQQDMYFDSVHQLRHGRSDVVPRFLRSIEDSLAGLGESRSSGSVRASGSPTVKLALTDSAQLDDSLVLSDIATKVELRVREPLYALGHRFGALAGTTRIATEIMPLGPRSIVEALRYGTAHLDLVLEDRLLLYRCFERVVMNQIGTLYVALNNCLAERNVLPHLHTLSTGADATTEPAASVSTNRLSGTARPGEAQPTPLARPSTVGPRLVSTTIRRNSSARHSFGKMRQLLAACRGAETYTASSGELQVVLAELQARQAAAASTDAKPSLRSAEEIKQEILALLHERCADGRTPRIGEEDNDAIDLTAMLFEFLSRRARSDGMANWILAKLQLPILRAALKDTGFFSDATHAARRVLNDFAEAGQFWIDENEAEKDPALVETLQRLVNQIACEYQGEAAVLVAALQELSRHIETLARRVEVAERRHVEAAMGREKLEQSRLLAAAAIGERVARNKPNEFLRTLLEHGWTDVLTVALLREGADSASYRRRLDVVDQLLAAVPATEGQSPSPELRFEVESGLKQVGLYDDDIRSIAQKLFVRAEHEQPDNPISQTELAIKLKQRVRLGGEQKRALPPASVLEPKALEPKEQAALERLQRLPLGTWFEFTVNPEGDTVRRKLSWYSVHTGCCLFINQHGVPSEEKTMQELARDIAGEQARMASAQQEPLIGHAWTSICDTLNSFSECKQGSRESISPLTERRPDKAPHHLLRQTPQPQKSLTLLVVDDEVNIQRALTRLLRDEGYRILCATSASEGMEMLRQHEVQVIVSDQRMPGMSGTDFLNIVKTTHPNTVRILLSGYSDVAAVTNAINRGVVYKFLTKPWDDDDIRTQVRDAFRASDFQTEDFLQSGDSLHGAISAAA